MSRIAALIALLLLSASELASAQEASSPRLALHGVWDPLFHFLPDSIVIPADFVRASGPDGTRYAISRTPHFTGPVFDRAAVCREQYSGDYAIVLGLTAAAGTWFADFSRANVGNVVAVVLNGKVLAAPFIREPILGGQLQVSGAYDLNEAHFLEAVYLGRDRLDEESRSKFKRQTFAPPPLCNSEGLLGEPEDASDTRALDYLTKAIEKNANDTDALALRGSLHCRHERWQEGIDDYTRALALKSDSSETRAERGRCFLGAGDYHSAIVDLDSAVAAGYDRAYAAEFRARAYSLAGRYQDATADLNFLIDRYPGQSSYHFERAFNYAEIERHDLSVLDYQKAIDLGDQSADAFSNKAWSHFKLHEFHIGLRDVNRAIEIDPALAFAFSTRAHLYEALGENEKAIADYEKALSLDSSLDQSKAGLARLKR